MKQYPILYKRTVSGAIQTWRQEVDGNRYRTISGQLDGKAVESGWHICETKNEGRANSTTPEEQAIKQVEANYKKRKELGYWENVKDIDKPIFFKPMLAATYDGMKKSGAKEVYSQPKLDGMRCVTNDSGSYSRGGKRIVSAPHIHAFLEHSGIFESYPSIVFDGELYNHGLKDNFNELMSLAKRTKPTEDDLAASAKMLQYHVYDLYDADRPDLTFTERHAILSLIVMSLGEDSPLRLVPTHVCRTEEAIDNRNIEYLELGYEGQIIRLDKAYEKKRTKSLLKRKEFMDEEFQIEEIQEGNGNRAGMAGRIIYRLPDGRTFGSGIAGGEAFYIQLLKDKDKYRGGEGTVKHFTKTPDGIPRFPVTTMVYEGKRDV